MKKKYPNCLIIFVKNPIMGSVKTRIGNEVGHEKALKIYHILLDYTHQLSKRLNLSKKLYYNNHIDSKDTWENEIYDKKIQTGDELGLKMYNAIEDELKNTKKVILIGSDNGELTQEIIHTAYEILDTHDIVLGPANDGGYYLVGMKSIHPIFHGIEWSTEKVLSDTIAIVNKLGLTYDLLPPLNDIDYYEDWLKWEQKKIDKL